MRFVIAAIIFSIALSAPAFCEGSDAEPYFAHYTSANDIELDFENDAHPYSDGTLKFTSYSEKYDLNKTSVIFYEYNQSGIYGDTSRTYSFEVNEIHQYGYKVDFTVKNVNANIEIIFAEPITYSETGYDPTKENESDNVPKDPTQFSKNNINIDVSLVISFVAVLISFIMIISCAKSFNSITSILKGDGS